VSTRSVAVLRSLRADAPWVIRLLSVPNRRIFANLKDTPASIAEIDGVSIRHSILTAVDATWLRTRQLLILAWVVNGAPRLNELVRYGIHAAVSDNLAIIELLGGHGHAEAALTTRRMNG
jgi:hypothetical protein